MAIGFVIRGGILVGAIAYSKKLGIWDDSERADRIYNDIKSQITPYASLAKSKLPIEVPSLPDAGEVRFLLKYYYNQGVKQTFRFVHMLPCYLGRGLKKVKDEFEQFATPPKPSVTASSSSNSNSNKD